MKKFILSATLALACFTTQANNEIIKNDDDKNPKSKAKVVTPACSITVYGGMWCSDGSWAMSSGTATAGNCAAATRVAHLFALAEAITMCSY